MDTQVNQDFTTTLLVDQTPSEVFNAVNNVRGWWSKDDITGETDHQGAEFNFRHEFDHIIHHSDMKIVEFVPDTRIVWLVTYSFLNFVKDTQEWTDTKVRFDISRQGDKTRLVFTHEGLVPRAECYEICTPAWTHYVQDSLLPLITTGKGRPD